MFSYQGLNAFSGAKNAKEEDSQAALDLPELGVENERLKTTITILNQ